MSSQNGFVSFYKTARWFVLAGLILAIYLAMQEPPPPDLPDNAMFREDATGFAGKLSNLELARRRGEQIEVHFAADEVNAAMNSPELAQMADSGGRVRSATALPAGSGGRSGTLVAFNGDQATGYFIATVYGRDFSVQLSAKVSADHGYVTLDPTGLKVGDLPLPVFLAKPVLQRTLEAPEARAKMQLPDFIQNVRVENGELIVTGGAQSQ